MKPRHPATAPPQPVQSARAVGLRYVNDGHTGIKRLKSGAGFRYVNAHGKSVRDAATLKRIRTLAIPPAWTDVWICASENGHLQATGRDAKGRKQHRYHPLWREVRDATKYDRMIEFGETLPRIRRRAARHSARPGLCREKVLATIVRLMDLTFIRVGNEEYARDNRSYGLTTMKDQHAKIRGGRVQFSFRGKSGKFHTIAVEDRRLATAVKHCQDIPGQELFQWLDGDGKRRDVTSGEVNRYLRQISGSDFTAKDFRTWAGTVLAAQALQATAGFHTQRQAQRNIKQAIEVVAEKLGNTVAVCRKCYIHPFIVDAYLQKKLPGHGAAGNGRGKRAVRARKRPRTSLGGDEKAVLEFLRGWRHAERRETKRRLNAAAIPRAWRPRVVRGMRVGHR